MSKLRYFVINKPYGVLSQFTREAPHHRVLGDLFDFPKDVYPVGRLDQDSEGLLLLTNDKSLNQTLLHPSRKHARTYWVQVEGAPTAEALAQLRQGVQIRIKNRVHHCLPIKATILTTPTLPDRDPPVRFRKSIPTTWLSLTLTEGKNRQVRRMCAAVGFPVLRLVRSAIEDLALGELQPGAVLEMAKPALIRALHL